MPAVEERWREAWAQDAACGGVTCVTCHFSAGLYLLVISTCPPTTRKAARLQCLNRCQLPLLGMGQSVARHSCAEKESTSDIVPVSSRLRMDTPARHMDSEYELRVRVTSIRVKR